MVKVKHNLAGKTFANGRITVLYQAEDYIRPSSGKHEAKWHCRCECGTEFDVLAYSLTSGNTKSCGCYQKECVQNVGCNNKRYNDYVIRDDYVIMYTRKNEPFFVSLADFGKVYNYCWYKNNYGYLTTHVDDTSILIHRLITHCPDDLIVDHIHGTKSIHDNRRENLRIVTYQENCMNSELRSDNTSGTAGISYCKANGKWIVQIGLNGKMIYLGYYADLDEAIAVRRKAEDKYFGEFSYRRSREK